VESSGKNRCRKTRKKETREKSDRKKVTMFLNELKSDVEKKLAEGFDFGQNPLPDVIIQPAPAHLNADVSLPWAMSAAKVLKKSPLDIAKQCVELLKNRKDIETVEVAPPGFINLKLKNSVIFANCKNSDKDLDLSKLFKGERILIEFLSANPTGPLHIASGRGAGLGDSLVRIINALGCHAKSESYVNDIGNQVKLLGLSLKARHKNTELPEGGYHGEYLGELAKQIPENSDWSDEEYSNFALETLLKSHRKDMEAFNVKMDTWFRESEIHEKGLVEKVLKKLKADGKAKEKDGALWFVSSSADLEEKDEKDRVLIRKDGRPTYFLSDIAYHENKYQRGFTRLIDIWGADHHGYIPRMKASMLALGHDENTFEPIIHQMVHLNKNGVAIKMSKRSGEFITLRELVDDVGVDACRFFFASKSTNSHLNFDVDLAKKQTNENPVFYAQYVHARICSILNNAKGFDLTDKISDENLHEKERELAKKLLWFGQVLHTCAKDLSPHHLTNYLIELAGLFHSFYDSCKVLDDANPKISSRRLFICNCVKRTISKGLELIGVSSPEKM
jgi:arginyl-tRNA synthetase